LVSWGKDSFDRLSYRKKNKKNDKIINWAWLRQAQPPENNDHSHSKEINQLQNAVAELVEAYLCTIT
jgi:hypothetical protein